MGDALAVGRGAPRRDRRRRPCSARRRGRTASASASIEPRQALDLRRRLDVRPGVRVERDPGTRRRASPRRPSRGARSCAAQPSSVRRGVPGRSARPARGVAVRRPVERDAQHLAAARDEQPEPFADLGEGRRGRSVDRRRDRGVDLGQPQARARRARPQRVALRETRGRAGSRRSRSGRCRRGSPRPSVPSRRSAMSTLFQRIGTVPIDAPAERTADRAGAGGGGAPCSTTAGAGGAVDHWCCSSARPASQRACCSGWFGGLGRVPPAGLVGPGDREVPIDLDVDERRAARRRAPGGRPARPRRGASRRSLWIPNARADRREVRASRSSRRGSRSRSRPSARRSVSWPPLMLIQPELSRTTVQTGVAGEDRGLELLHRLEEVAVAADREDLAVGQGELGADRGRQREAHRREAARRQVGPRPAGHPALLDHALRAGRRR